MIKTYDISITQHFCFPSPLFSLDFYTMELGYKMMTLQHHLIWRRVVCANDPCFMYLSHWLTFMFFRQIDTIDIMIFRKFVLNIFERNSLKWFLFLLYLRGSLGLVAAFVPRIYLITFVPSRQVGRYRWGSGISKCETAFDESCDSEVEGWYECVCGYESVVVY